MADGIRAELASPGDPYASYTRGKLSSTAVCWSLSFNRLSCHRLRRYARAVRWHDILRQRSG